MTEWICVYCEYKNEGDGGKCAYCGLPKSLPLPTNVTDEETQKRLKAIWWIKNSGRDLHKLVYAYELGDKNEIYKITEEEFSDIIYSTIVPPPIDVIEKLVLALSEVFDQPEFVARCMAYIIGLNPNSTIAKQRLDRLKALCDEPEKSIELDNLRNNVAEYPDNPVLHYKYAIALLSSTPYYLTIDKEESNFWKYKGLEKEFPPPLWRFAEFGFCTPYISEAKEELYFALALGLDNQAYKGNAKLLIQYILKEQKALVDSTKYYDRDNVKTVQEKRIQRIRESAENIRAEIRLDEQNIDTRCALVEELLKAEPIFLTGDDDNFTLGLPDYITSIWDDAKKELELIIGLGAGNQMTLAKARFRLFQMYHIDQSGPTRPLLRDVIHSLKRVLRDNPNNIHALFMLKAAYLNLGDRQSVERVELKIKQARRLEEAGFIKAEQEDIDAVQANAKISDGANLEDRVQKLLRMMGLRAVTTKATGDGGIDVLAFSDSPVFSGKYIVQCKNWSNPVGEPIVRDLFGVTVSEGANKGILITTSTFTNAARRFAEGKQIELIDGEEMIKLFKQYGV